eukprot:comp18694_c0_seq1/m.20407 comp18694_c0_seq1/g.20407  ORF comp18694_c0_seq1/g.20407 comp18694_c0_seq1/m.20407 type:complete len:398 (-) comp18694_c0_seq1:361-1554(-)
MWHRRLLPVMKAPVAALSRQKNPHGFSVSVLQYNILGGYLAKPKYFAYCNPDLLEWNGRKQRILNEITHHSPDILCLEELTEYWTYFRTQLRSCTPPYDSAYLQRPSLHTSARAGRRKQDGCGIFWKEHMFNAVAVESFNLPDRHDRVALAVLLQHTHSKRFLLVCNTHLYWDATKVEEQLEELRFLDKELSRLLCDLPDPDIAVLLCGDLNNTPTSLVYKYMTTQLLGAKTLNPQAHTSHYTPDGVPLGGFPLPGSPPSPGSPGPNPAQVQQLPCLQSAYSDYRHLAFDGKNVPHSRDGGEVEEAPHTTVTDKRCSTIDYIFYNTSRLQLTHLLEVPSEADLRSEEPPASYQGHQGSGVRLAGIPNSQHSSDHLAIMAKFEAYPTLDTESSPSSES